MPEELIPDTSGFAAPTIVTHRNRFPNSDVFVIGSGTSLHGFNWKRLCRYCTIALNDVGIPEKTPGLNPDYHLFFDFKLWTKYRHSSLHDRTWVVCQHLVAKRHKRYEPCTFKDKVLIFSGVSNAATVKAEDDKLHVRHTISTEGIQLAWKLGAIRIFVLGLDCYALGKRKYHDDDINSTAEADEVYSFPQMVNEHEELREFFHSRNLYKGRWPETGIYNLSPKSRLTAWEKVPVEEVLS